ncbi:MAG: beta-ketoacyl-ACP synthase [Gammaproteobacteria bacterium]|nr:beta-ketoacyl-ACP synthase [Gammaproteobacteria bacterium]
MLKEPGNEVAIIGMGIVCSIGDTVQDFKQSLKKGVSGITRLADRKGPKLSVDIGAEIEKFSFLDQFHHYSDLPVEVLKKAKQCAQRSPFSVQASVLPALEAWQDSGMFASEYNPERLGVVVAGESTTQNYRYGLQADFENAPEYLSPRYALQYLDSNQVGVLSEILTIKGEGFVVGGASASGNVGIIKAVQLIQLGIVDTCLVTGVVADLSPIELQGFVNIGAMVRENSFQTPSKASRPFDRQHAGFVYGQASACVVLQSCGVAIQRGSVVQAKILGAAMNLDGVSTTEPSITGEAGAMNMALHRAGISASEINYLNAHGSSSPLGDVIEAKSIKQVFKDHVSTLWVNSTKGLTGHCLYSAGVVELIASVLQMEGEFIHPNKNLESPIDDDLRFSGATFEKEKIKFAMSNSFGFGGINSSIVLQNCHG